MSTQRTSSFDRIRSHLLTRGDQPVPSSMHDDLDVVVRRCDEVRSLGQGYGSVELSPYMSVLLGISSAAPAQGVAMGSAVAASV